MLQIKPCRNAGGGWKDPRLDSPFGLGPLAALEEGSEPLVEVPCLLLAPLWHCAAQHRSQPPAKTP